MSVRLTLNCLILMCRGARTAPFLIGSVLVLSGISPSCFAKAPTKTTGNIQAWSITQNEKAWGTMKLLVTKERLKLTDVVRKYSILVCKPDYDIFYFAENRKVYSVCPIKDYKGGFVQRISSFSGATGKIDRFKFKGQVTDLCGVKAKVYDPEYDVGKHHWQFLSAKDIEIAPPISRFLSIFYDFPDVHEVILRQVKGTNKKRIGLDTTEVKKVNIPLSEFDRPVGYKKVSAETVIFTITDF